MRPASNLFESPFTSTTPNMLRQQQQQQPITNSSSSTRNNRNGSDWLERTPLRRRENDSFATPIIYSNQYNNNTLEGQHEEHQHVLHHPRRRNHKNISSNRNGNSMNWIKQLMRIVLLSPVIVLAVWSIGSILLTSSSSRGTKRQQQRNQQQQQQQQYPSYGPPAPLRRRTASAVGGGGGGGTPLIRLWNPPSTPSSNSKKNSKNNNQMIGKMENGLHHAVEVVESAWNGNGKQENKRTGGLFPVVVAANKRGQGGVIVQQQQQQQQLEHNKKIVPFLSPLGATSTSSRTASLVAGSSPYQQSQEQQQEDEMMEEQQEVITTNNNKKNPLLSSLANYRNVVDGTIVRPRPVPIQRSFLVENEDSNNSNNLVQQVPPLQDIIPPPLQQQEEEQVQMYQLSQGQQNRLIVVQPPNLRQMNMEPSEPDMGQNSIIIPAPPSPEDELEQVQLQEEQQPLEQQQQQLMMGDSIVQHAILPAMDVDAPLRGQSQRNVNHPYVRRGGKNKKDSPITYLYYDPKQVYTNPNNGMVYIPDVVYDVHGQPILLSSLSNPNNGKKQPYGLPSIILEPPKGMVHHNNLTNSTVHLNITTISTTSSHYNFTHEHPNTVHTPVHDNRREEMKASAMTMSMPLEASTTTTDRFGSSKAFLSNGINWVAHSATNTIGGGAGGSYGTNNNTTDQSIIVSTMGVMALLLGAISARRLRHSRSLLSFCIENESMVQEELAYDTAYTISGDSYNTFAQNSNHTTSYGTNGGWKGDLEKFDV